MQCGSFGERRGGSLLALLGNAGEEGEGGREGEPGTCEPYLLSGTLVPLLGGMQRLLSFSFSLLHVFTDRSMC